jgi:two-component system response regulator PilR (NtrC family)
LDSGLKAVRRIHSEESIDLLMTDIRMSPMDGLELIAVAHNERPTMDIIVVSAYLDQETTQTALDLGATACVNKPFSLHEILQPVRGVLKKRTHHGETSVHGTGENPLHPRLRWTDGD